MGSGFCARPLSTAEVRRHHCSALAGSEVMYSRHLQTRAIRKLQVLLRRLRVGIGIEEEPPAHAPAAGGCGPRGSPNSGNGDAKDGHGWSYA